VRDGNDSRAANGADLQAYYGSHPRSLRSAVTPGAKVQRSNIFPVECAGAKRRFRQSRKYKGIIISHAACSIEDLPREGGDFA